MTPRRRDSDASLLLRWWPLIVALVTVTAWSSIGVYLAHRADRVNGAQWQAISDLRERLARVEGHH